MRTEGRTDKTKLIVAFHNCENAPKNQSINALQRHDRCSEKHQKNRNALCKEKKLNVKPGGTLKVIPKFYRCWMVI